MKQGEIWFADLNPIKGSEQAGFRPVVIISGNLLNDLSNLVICCPLTTKIKNYHGNVVLEPDQTNGLKQPSEILTFHIRSLSRSRLKQKIGKIKLSELKQIQSCLQDIMVLKKQSFLEKLCF